ncbi:ferrous iron transport protein A [Rheinheimera mesophila]|uniref:Ferrous iron transport protein A n=2 Tax=Rheinheimera mesophila TaxID=1547515 RepID=A0A3P3QF67_9GAMM|nr:iron transporter FeoA [Rheinheimera mesophila]RRJ19050.1 ferrous iron transport protein A [Rheinheimera mesophila]
MTLWDVPGGQSVIVTALDAALDPSVHSRLREMGLEHDHAVHCLRRGPFQGTLVVAIADCVYSLEQQIAKKIQVKPL